MASSRLKTHAKVSLVVRREGGELRSYVHFGTGNYHPDTAKVYTDLSFFTCDPALCRDAARLFNYMTGYATPATLEKIAVAPLNLRQRLVELIDDEIAHARAGRPAQIWAKMNALVDPAIIDGLYRASQAGVEIDLVVRGICCLRPGVPGLSENIRVKSIIGRFLEHGRDRLLRQRQQAAVARGQGLHLLGRLDAAQFRLARRGAGADRERDRAPPGARGDHGPMLRDEAQTWWLDADGVYRRDSTDPESFSAHTYFMTNPSLSGRGSALHRTRPSPRLVSEKAAA